MTYPDSSGGTTTGAAMPVNQTVYATNHTVAPGEMLVMFDTADGDKIAMLPHAAAAFAGGKGNIYVLKKVGSDENAVMAIDPGGLLIDGISSASTSSEKGFLMLQSIQTGWVIIGRY